MSSCGVFRSSDSASITATNWPFASFDPVGSASISSRRASFALSSNASLNASKVDRLTIVRLQHLSRSTSPGHCVDQIIVQQLPDRHEIACRFRHLVAFDLQEAVVHPVVRHHGRAVRAARLRDFVFMVREDQVETAAMDVEDIAEIGGGSWPSIRYASPDGPCPTGFPSPAHRRTIASTARSRPGVSCGHRPRRARRPVARRACGPTARRSPASMRYRTELRRRLHRHGRARSVAGSASPCRPCHRRAAARNRSRAARMSAAGNRAPPRRHETGWRSSR